MTVLLGITSATLAVAAAWNSDFIAAGIFTAGAIFFAVELEFGRTFTGGSL